MMPKSHMVSSKHVILSIFWLQLTLFFWKKRGLLRVCVHQSELHFTTDQECAACNRYRFFFFFCDAAMPWLRGGEGKHRRFCIHANFILSANPSPFLLPTETFAASQRYQAAGQSGGRSFFGSRDPGQLGGHARGVYALITVTRSLALAIAIKKY